MKYQVEVEKMLRQVGWIEIEAQTPSEAVQIVRRMMDNPNEPLQTTDSRISWDWPRYVDDTFVTYGGVEEAQ